MAVLETSVTSKTRETMKKTPKNDKKEVKKVLVVAQELKLARVLAGNNKTARDRALKSLKKWFRNRSTTIPFTEDDFLRLWKGLFYSMWMSDKPLIQEECAENIASLVHELPLDTSILFYKCGMLILINEWFGIDQLRLDKFLMFVRRLLRQALFILKNDNWSTNSIRKFTNCLSETILTTEKQKPLGLLLHFIELYLEELAKVSKGEIRPQLMIEFLSPFIKQLAYSDDSRIINHLHKHIFIYLIRQSDLGLEYDEKYKAWRNLRFPGSIDDIKKIEVSDDEELEEEGNKGERPFDPRAGRVDVNLPQLKFHAKVIAKALSEYKFDKKTNSKSRKSLNELAEHFKKLGSGIYPLGIKKIKLANDPYDTNIRKAVNRLVKFDQKIKGQKNRKRKNENHGNDGEIELRGGKKIKLDDGLCEKLEEQLNNRLTKKKRKNEDILEAMHSKQKKKKMLEIESIFRRNSGTWLVTKTIQQEPKEDKKRKSEENQETIDNENASPEKEEKKKWKGVDNNIEVIFEDEAVKNKGLLFPKNEWDDEETDVTTNNQKKKRLSLPENLIRDPFANSTPVKKVKINTKLNKSQDVREHHAQILSSPAIPYDANKKPLKPLLKTSFIKSPVNPFYTF